MEWDVENLAEQQSELPDTVGLRKEGKAGATRGGVETQPDQRGSEGEARW